MIGASDGRTIVSFGGIVNFKGFGYRRSVAVGAVWLAGFTALAGATSPANAATDPAGTGSAYAQGYKIDPRSGRLSFGITYGLALAGHQNKSAVAEARSADLGLIGTTLSGEGCDGGDPTLPAEDQPIPLVARTDDPAPDRQSSPELGAERSVDVNPSPFAKAVATTTGFGQPKVVSIGGTVSTSTSGLENGARVARAVTEVSDIDIAGLVQIKGMRWEAAYQTFPSTAVLTSFTVEGIFLAGTNITGKQDNPFASLQQVTDLLAPLGLGVTITPPTLRNESGIAFVDALKISIVPGEVRDGVLGPVLAAAQPLRKALNDALIGADCGNASYLTIGDIALGSVTGAGELNIELGGVSATSADLDPTSFLGGFTPAPPAPAAPTFTPPTQSASGGTFEPSTPSLSTVDEPVEVAATPVVTTPVASLPDIKPIRGDRGGALLGVGLGGLFLLGLLAEGDRRKMRRGQRSGPMEVKA